MSRAHHDVAIIGAGVIGLSVARELVRRELSVLVIDKEHDVGRGASGRNSGVVHPGFSVEPDTLKARLNVEGSRLLRQVCADLSVPFDQCGTLVVAASTQEIPDLESKLETGLANGLQDLRIIGREELGELEPGVAGCAALYSPDGAIIDPRALVLRLAENARANGCDFSLSDGVREIARDRPGSTAQGTRRKNVDDLAWVISSDRAEVRATVLVNAAGVAAPDISRLASGETFESFPCRGEYLILDQLARGVPSRMVYPTTPKSGGLGVHFTPTTEGNTLIGPSAEYIEGGEDYATTPQVLARLFEEARSLCPDFDPGDVIATFAGVRAKIGKGSYGSADFVVEESRSAPALFNLVGIESPGLSASPAIARMAAALVLSRFPDVPQRAGFDPTITAPTPFARLAPEAARERAAAHTDDRTIVCRCERVTRAEVLAALDDPLGARTLAAVKARCHAGAGRCQGGFCTPRIIRIMRDDLGMPVRDITLKGPGSEMLVGEAKELLL